MHILFQQQSKKVTQVSWCWRRDHRQCKQYYKLLVTVPSTCTDSYPYLFHICGMQYTNCLPSQDDRGTQRESSCWQSVACWPSSWVIHVVGGVLLLLHWRGYRSCMLGPGCSVLSSHTHMPIYMHAHTSHTHACTPYTCMHAYRTHMHMHARIPNTDGSIRLSGCAIHLVVLRVRKWECVSFRYPLSRMMK